MGRDGGYVGSNLGDNVKLQNRSDFGRDVVCLLAFLFIMYFAVAEITFSIRHPWATETERLVYSGTVLSFGHVEYKDARPRE